MSFQLHTRAGIAPPFQTLHKRIINIGTSGASLGLIGNQNPSTTIIIELDTQLGAYIPDQGNNRNVLFASDVGNTLSAAESGVHRYEDGKIGVSVGGNSRRVFSLDAYDEGDVVLIRLELTFPSTADAINGNVDFYINGILQGSTVARSEAFNNSNRAWALNSYASNSFRSNQHPYLTDQYIRRFYVNRVGADYERNWVFNQSSGFIVPDQLGSDDLLYLFGGNGIDIVGQHWPTDNSQWVFYDDGGTGDVDQAESTSGTLATTATTASTTNAVNQQLSSSSGVASALASLNAGTSAVNALANVQAQSSSGVVNAQGFTAASTLVSHVQSAASTGLVNAQANSAAITQAVNSLANSQIASSSGVTSSAASTQAVTGATHSQALSTNAISTSVGSSAANTVAVNELFTLVQAVESGGITSVYATAIATTQANIEQVVNASGVADAVASTNANTLGQEFDSPWSTPTILFSEAQPIEQISLTFDQLGRPLVFYRVGEDTLKLYWYDPVAQQNVTTTLTTGKDPTACFDFPQDTGQSFTDALLFYVRDDQVFMRVQRDRYAIEYPCPAMQPGLKIKSAGLRSDNRLQVVYQFRDDNYVKPVIPVPPPPPGLVDGVSKYFFSGWNSGIETPWRMAGPIADTEFEIGMEITGFEPSRISTYVSPTFRSTVSQGGRADFIQDPRIVAEHIIFAITAGKSAGGLNSSAISGFAELAVSTVRTQSNIVRSLFIHYQNYPDQVVNLNVGLGEYDKSLLRFVFGPRLNDQPNRRSLTIVGTFKNAGQPQDPEMVDRVICETDMPAGVLANDLFNNAAVNSRLFFGTRLAFFPDGRPVYAYSLLGTISNCYARDGNNVTQWPITTRGQATQPSTPPGKDAVIINHDSVLWGYTQP